MVRRGRAWLVVAAATLALTAAGCRPGTSGHGTADPAAFAAARTAVRTLEQRPDTLQVPALPHRPAAGRTIDFVACGLPVCIKFGSFVSAAARAVGWHFRMLDAGLTPQTVSTAYDQVVRDRPDGVIGSGGFDPSLFTHQLGQLKALDVPVVLVDVARSAPGVTGVILDSAFQAENGREMGQWIMHDSGGHDAHVTIVSSPATPIYDAAHTELKKVIDRGCGSCSVDTYSFKEADILTKLPTDLAVYLTSHRQTNYLFFDFNSELDGLPAALQSAGFGHDVKITTTDTTEPESGYLEDGSEAATAAIPWPEMLWGAFNVVLRADQGASVRPALRVRWPHMIITGDNLISRDRFPLVADYRAVYEKAWHLR